MWIAWLISVAVLSFIAGVVATVAYFVYIADDIEEASEKFEAMVYKGEKK